MAGRSHLVPSEQSPAEQVSRQAELGGPVPLRQTGETDEQLRTPPVARLLSAGPAAALCGRVSAAARPLHICSRCCESERGKLNFSPRVGAPAAASLSDSHAASLNSLRTSSRHRLKTPKLPVRAPVFQIKSLFQVEQVSLSTSLAVL